MNPRISVQIQRDEQNMDCVSCTFDPVKQGADLRRLVRWLLVSFPKIRDIVKDSYGDHVFLPEEQEPS